MTTKLINTYNSKTYYCDDIKKVKIIDGVEYVTVYTTNPNQTALMRKESFRIEKDGAIYNVGR